MCGTCGCGKQDGEEMGSHTHEHHAGGAGRGVLLATPHARRIRLEHDVLRHNETLARRNRELFRARNVFALNLMSSPGSGKTTLLERTIRESGLRERMFVVQGDQATDRDAARIERAGARAFQINTGQGCHLDASMVSRGFAALDPPPATLLAIENVGNLVCPAMFDLGESARVAIISTTEGADKPLKYPHMFRTSDLVLVNKMDLLEHVDFRLEECIENVHAVNPKALVLPVSARRGDGFAAWYEWLRQGLHRQNVESELRGSA
jgi:hydrogenase nickel incorporation protein HypB